jgi:rhodanese-related sulfurtransferase
VDAWHHRVSITEDRVADNSRESGNKSENRSVYLSPDQLAERLRAEPAPLVLDVRDPQELIGELGKLSGAVNVPLTQLKQRLGELSTKGREDIVVVCRTGRRSEAAARILQESGIERVFVLKGGMTAWRDAHRRT